MASYPSADCMYATLANIITCTVQRHTLIRPHLETPSNKYLKKYLKNADQTLASILDKEQNHSSGANVIFKFQICNI